MAQKKLDNPFMDITKRVAHNLSVLMKGHKTLGTLKLVAAAAGIGFGTVRRAKNGDGNITVQNLDALAKVFGKTAEDLLADPRTGAPPQANESRASYQVAPSSRIPTRLANLTEAQLDKLLTILNLVENWETNVSPASPIKPAAQGWIDIPAGKPAQQPTADTKHQSNT